MSCIELDDEESAVSSALISANQADETSKFYIVGSAINHKGLLKKVDLCFIRVYRFSSNFCELILLHKTAVEYLPTAFAPFNSGFLAGIGPILRLYDIGRKRVLRRAEFKQIPNIIVQIHHLGKRIYVADVQESILFLKYYPKHNEFNMFADDITKRFVTSMYLIDYDSVVIGDKFGNISVLRLPTDFSFRVEENLMPWKVGSVKNQSFKVKIKCNFFVGDVVTSICRAKFQPGGDEEETRVITNPWHGPYCIQVLLFSMPLCD